MKNLLLLMVVVLITIPACIDVNQAIEGEGPIVKETLDISAFSKLLLDSSFDVYITQGDEQIVEAEGQQNIIDNLKRSVSNDEFILDLKSGNYRNFDLTIYITVPTLTKMTIDGSGNIFIDNFEGNEMEFYIDGSGNITVDKDLTMDDFVKLTVDGSGNIEIDKIYAPAIEGVIKGSGDMNFGGVCERTTFTSDGSGNIETFGLASTECDVRAEGSGNTEVWVSEKLEVRIDGSGDVSYRGNPSIDVNIDGSGRLIDAN